MIPKTIFLVLSAALSLAAPTSDSKYPTSTSGHCTSFTISETVTSDNHIWDGAKFHSDFDVAAWNFNVSLQNNDKLLGFSRVVTQTKTYELSATFCRPKNTSKGKSETVLIATHGLGFDSR